MVMKLDAMVNQSVKEVKLTGELVFGSVHYFIFLFKDGLLILIWLQVYV